MQPGVDPAEGAVSAGRTLWNNDQISQLVMTVKSTARDQVRDSLLDAMDRLLARYGYQKTTVDDLAAEAGIGKGTVYLYFSSKEQVALSCIDRFHDRLVDELQAISGSQASSYDKVVAVMKERVRCRFEYCRNTSSFSEMLSALQGELLSRKARYHQEEASVLESILKQGAKAREWPACDFKAAADAIVHATNGFLPYSLKVSQLGSWEEIEGQIECLAQLLVYGVGGLPPRPNPIGS